ncbi:MAG: Crp/Fnr family transcriptional regulator [Mesorhizobium sp.]|uniref:Crp/Fnr family transcriptional regulator n=1 Tax=unclassified Mesorhizobium TaxID=325217 RepID=UPI000FCC91C9|nr:MULTISPECIES: Crp/Fnr family transcriptional regulator [unclassified Mesorhizobium]RUV73244.1 Crp/Fnr family transcriptional regulator [Mesorhizobium sp. M5C.F.Cr.IN.023.01.1.1]RWF86668.1 MAG: Crp/Fnr family transcriptional regulator [Mesorhizobium sp.]RWF95371.1 MAG: Crp/Fnr family transcriptional regulator [Mesorhizobium sp.]RWI39790.1 MAG: Crp/Fnr family transcriptional regulator [Mesorhizobium sp.]RWI45344.1 MAG: Crp/Fnr family transcriptional regulator [Mesorhizobium sp.]
MGLGLRQDVHTSGIPVLCTSCEARHRGVCGALQPDQLVALARASTKQHLDEGSEVVGDAEVIESYANILSGVVKLTKALPDGRQQIVGLQFAPDFLGRPFGRESVLDVEAATDLSLCTFPKSALERLIDESPALEKRILGQTLRELDEARQWMLTLGRKTASEKVASFLLLIAQNIDPLEPDRRSASFDLPLSRADIADFLGLTIETVSRQLTKLSAERTAIVHNRHVEIPNLAKLSRVAGV